MSVLGFQRHRQLERTACPRTTGCGGEAQQLEADRALLRLRQLRSFRHAARACCGAGGRCLPHPARCILAALQRGAGPDMGWVAALHRLALRPMDELPGLIEQAERGTLPDSRRWVADSTLVFNQKLGADTPTPPQRR